MPRPSLTTLVPIAALAIGSLAVGCAAQPNGASSSPPVPQEAWKAGPPASSEEHPGWVHDYWDMYGLVSEGSMWNPEAFLELAKAPESELARVQLEVEVEEVAEPIDEEEPMGVFVDPTLSAACGISEPEVRFAVDSTGIQDDEAQTLARLAECLTEEPLQDELLSITGHADPRGTEEYNRELGLDRADAVAAALSQRGVAPERIDTYSRGEYLASDDPDAWPSDRRVSIDLDR